MKHFIESVRKYPCLWKIDMEEYKINDVKEAAWRNVIKECNLLNVKEAKILWKKLRDGHRQALNKRKTVTAQAANSESRTWKYEKLMDFLLPHIANRPRHTSAITASTQDESYFNISEQNTTETTQETGDLNMNEMSNESKQIPSTPQNKRKRDKLVELIQNEQKIKKQRALERGLFRKELLNKIQNKKPKTQTAMETFFDSMCKMSKELPEYLQMRVQRQIFNIVMEAREENLGKRTTTSSI